MSYWFFCGQGWYPVPQCAGQHIFAIRYALDFNLMRCLTVWGCRSLHMGHLSWNWIPVSVLTGMPRFWAHHPLTHTANVASPKPKVSLEDAFRTAEGLLDGNAVKRIDTDDPRKYLVYLAKEDGSAILTYRFIIKNKCKSILFEALVDAHSGQLVWITDLVFHASVGLWVSTTIF